MMRLSVLLQSEISKSDPELSGLCLDSRTLQPGEAFIAYPGAQFDGRDYIDTAIERGAAAILYDPTASKALTGKAVPCIAIPELAQQLPSLAQRYYGHPQQHLTLIGITGTNGKTSVSHYVAQLLAALGQSVGVIGTVGWGKWGAPLQENQHTTPDVITLYRQLNALIQQRVTHVVMEVSSHGLDQGRVAGLQFAVGVVTNITQDHLDYHHTMAAYVASKRRLLALSDTLVLNDDDRQVRAFSQFVAVPLLRYGSQGDLCLSHCDFDTQGIAIRWDFQGETYHSQLNLWGHYQVENALAAVSALLQLGYCPEQIHQVFNQLTPVKGRLEVLRHDKQPTVIIDYAHTPDALAQTLQAVRQHVAGRLWCVFGCGGDRDRSKRPLMAGAAEQHADKLIITEDNSRTEPVTQIMQDICAGLNQPPEAMISEREDAIIYALQHATSNDVILLAGKGHETYLDVQGAKKFFDERRIVRCVWENEGNHADSKAAG